MVFLLLLLPLLTTRVVMLKVVVMMVLLTSDNDDEGMMAVLMVALGAIAVYLLEVMARHSERKAAERMQNPKPTRHGKKTQ